ncbi:MAG: hypothetical protein OXC00_00875, partial [Acidimicrobiaceae bacterium]|nr:hypothetical protein [Acidimicrobiaceae bacterium]
SPGSSLVMVGGERRAPARPAAARPAVLGPGGAMLVGTGVALMLGSRWLDGAGESAAMGWQAAIVALARRRLDGVRALAVLGGAVVAVAVTVSVLAAASPVPGWSDIGDARLLRHESVTVVVLDGPVRPRDLLESLRLAGVRRVDLVVASHGGASDAHAVLALRDRYRRAAVVAPPMHRVPGARTVRAGDVVRVGVLAVEVVADQPELTVTVASPEVPPVGAPRGPQQQESREGRGRRRRGGRDGRIVGPV